MSSAFFDGNDRGDGKTRPPEEPSVSQPEPDEPAATEGDATARQPPNDTAPIDSSAADSAAATEEVPTKDVHVADDQDGMQTTPPHHLAGVELGIPLDPPKRADALGTLDRYQVLSLVGRGGMGVVVRAFEEELHRHVALKVMSASLLRSERARERFVREARAAAGINHPNVVTIHAVAEHAAVPYLVMEYIDGTTLDKVIREQGPMELRDVIHLGAQIASGIAAAHEKGIIHRDIKPSNVLLQDNIQRIKITDFGLARLLMDNSDLTSQGDVVGTPAYMSPEQVKSDKVVPQSDLFSLGCVLYTMLAGRNPFSAQTSIAMGHRVVTLNPPPISTLRKDIPPSLDQLLVRLLQKRPGDRPAKASDVAAVLHRLLVDVNQSDAADHLPAAAARPRRRWVAPATAVTAALMASALGVWQWRQPPAGSAESNAAAAITGAASAPAASGPVRLIAGDDSAAFSSLGEAIDAAAPGATIQLEPGEYRETIRFDDPSRHRDLTIEAAGDARLSFPRVASVVEISGVPGLTLRGLTITSQSDQNAIKVTGACPGLTIETCELESHDSGSAMAMLYLTQGASGSPEAPLRIDRCRLRNCRIGIVVGPEAFSDHLTSDVIIERCRVRCAASDVGIPLVMWHQLRSVRVEGNLFAGGSQTLSLEFPEPHSAEGVVLRHNTFHTPRNAVNFNSSTAAQEIKLQSNLFVQCDRTYPSDEAVGAYQQWFQDNVWVTSGNADETMLSLLAWGFFESDEFASLDPSDPAYVKLGEAAPEEFREWFSRWVAESGWLDSAEAAVPTATAAESAAPL